MAPFEKNRMVYMIESIDEFEKDKPIQEALGLGKQIGVLIECNASQSLGRFLYIEVKSKKINDMWKIHGRDIKVAYLDENQCPFMGQLIIKNNKIKGGLQNVWNIHQQIDMYT